MTHELKRILVVEDEPELLEVAELTLADIGGYEVAACLTGQEALVRAACFRPDLLVLDVMMPGTDGLELLALLRRAGVSAPVVFLTAKVQPSEVKRYRDAGALDVIPKPYEPEELCEALRDVWAARADQPAALRVSGAAEGLRSRRA